MTRQFLLALAALTLGALLASLLGAGTAIAGLYWRRAWRFSVCRIA